LGGDEMNKKYRVILVSIIALLTVGMSACGTKKPFLVDSNPQGAMIVATPMEDKVNWTRVNGLYVFSETPLGETPKDVVVNFSKDTETIHLTVEKRGYTAAHSVLDLNAAPNLSFDLERIDGVSEKIFTKDELASENYAILPPYVGVYIHSGVGNLDKTEFSVDISREVTENISAELSTVVDGSNKQMAYINMDEALSDEWQNFSDRLNSYLLKLNKKRLPYYSLPPLVSSQVKGFEPFLEKLTKQPGNDRPYLVYAWSKCVSETTGRKVGNVVFGILGAATTGVYAGMGQSFYYDPTAFNPDSGTLTILFVIDAKTSEVVHMEHRVFADITKESACKKMATDIGKFPENDTKKK